MTLHQNYNNQQHPFHLVKPSPWPILVAFSISQSLLFTVLWFNTYSLESCWFLQVISFNVYIFFYAFINWLWDIIIEATFEGYHTTVVQTGLRFGFMLFIISEIMFFFSFFWTFFYSAVNPSIWIGNIWPPLGLQTINPWLLPLLNTIILLSSGITVTWAHKVIVNASLNKKIKWRFDAIKALVFTILLGIIFTGIQLYEYQNSSFSINDSIYGSIFFLLTGFHGFHVLVGTIFLMVCLFRQIFYHFTSDHHLGLEMAIWYWHFVDIVWIFLFIFVYVWGGL